MIEKQLLQFLIEQNEHLRTLFPNLSDEEKWNYAQTIKLSEEVGEMSEAVLAHYQTQRKSKATKVISLEKEIADVLITTMLIATSMHIDINEALEERIAAIKHRRKTD